MAKDKRVEVLFEPSEYKILEEAAHREGKSVGHMVREAVVKYVTGPTEEERRKAFEELLSMEPIEMPEWEVLKEEMAQARYDDFMKSMNYDPPPEFVDEAP